MRFTAQTSSGGVCEQLFLLGDIPGVLWTPEGAGETRPLIVMGHGGGQHKKAPDIVDRARRFVAECGFAVVAADAPGHGDRPEHEEFTRIAAGYEARLEAGEGLAPLIASFQAGRTLPDAALAGEPGGLGDGQLDGRCRAGAAARRGPGLAHRPPVSAGQRH
jgi:hypothetical protein